MSERRRHSCSWCSLTGHHQTGCWIEAEGRREPDEYDMLAHWLFCDSTARTRVRRTGQLAKQLRVAAAAGRLRLL